MSVAFDWIGIATVIGAAAVTLAARASFIVLPATFHVPTWFTRSLGFVAAAVLPALIVPDVLFRELVEGSTVNVYRVAAASIAALVAWRTKNIFATLGVGMATLWLLKWLGAL
jgi:branched-subunit amino acid transport protein